MPGASATAKVPAWGASCCPRGLSPIPQVLAVLPDPLELQSGQCRATAPRGHGQSETDCGQDPLTPPCPSLSPWALGWPSWGEDLMMFCWDPDDTSTLGL